MALTLRDADLARAVAALDDSSSGSSVRRSRDTATCSALMEIMSFLPRLLATSGVATMAQAAPSLTPQQS